MERPDLSGLDPAIITYINFLEHQLEQHRTRPKTIEREIPVPVSEETIFTEPPTTVNIFTCSRKGLIKRTPRHMYGRQHRGGIGVFDLDVPPDDQPQFLLCADMSETILLFSNKAKVFRYSAEKIEESPIRAKGAAFERLQLDSDEYIVAALPERASGYVALASRNGFIRCLRHHLFGEHMRPGTAMYNAADYGPLASVCWTPGNQELLLVSRNGIAIRFSEKSLPPQGARGINLSADDQVVSVTWVEPDSQVFVAGADGKGTIRLMSGFAPNKSPGGSGKILIKSDEVISATKIAPTDDLFIITRLGKIIRFLADEVPTTEGTIQGVFCMGLRGDEVAALTTGTPAEIF